MGSIIAIVAIIMGVSIPISAIISSAVLRYKKLQLQSQEGITKEEKILLKQALQENEMLRQRVENLEMVTSDPDILKIGAVRENELQHQIDDLKQEVKKLNKENTL